MAGSDFLPCAGDPSRANSIEGSAMKKSVFALAAIFTVFTASATIAGRDELQMQIIRKAMEAKQAAQKNE